MAMSVTTTEVTHTSCKKVTFAWTSAAGGTASATTTATFDGDLIGMATIPDGTAAPSDNYDITVSDANGHDVLLGQGANRATATTQYVAGTSLTGVSGSKLTLAVANAGDTKKGTVVLWIR